MARTIRSAAAASGYDCANVLLDGIRRAHSTAPDAVITALDATANLPGVSVQSISFTPENHVALKVSDLGIYQLDKHDGVILFDLLLGLALGLVGASSRSARHTRRASSQRKGGALPWACSVPLFRSPASVSRRLGRPCGCCQPGSLETMIVEQNIIGWVVSRSTILA